MRRALFGLLSVVFAAAPLNAAELTVSAAASLKDALEALKPGYEAASKDKLTFNFAGSGALQQQIENGAPVDLFVSAAAQQMDALEAKNKIEAGTRADLVKNALVLVAPKDSKLGLKGFQDLVDAKVKKIAVGDAKTVPAGKYAAEVFKALKIDGGVEKRLVFGNNVRQVLTYAENKDVEAAIVYATDANASKGVIIVATAEKAWHAPIVYPMAVIAGSKNKDAAMKLANYLKGEEAAKVFREHGFLAANDPS